MSQHFNISRNSVLCLLTLFITGCCIFSACNRGGVPDRDTTTAGIIRIACDSTLRYVTDQEIFVFQNEYKYATILVDYLTGEDAYKRLRSDSIRLVIGYREANSNDSAWFLNQHLQPRTHMIGADAMVLICSKFKVDKTISVAGLADWIHSDTAVIKSSGRKIIFDHPASTVARMFLSKLNVTDTQPKGTFAANNIHDVLAYASADSNAIGVIPYTALLADTSLPGSGVSIMAVSDSVGQPGVLPELKTIGNRTYPFILGIYIVSREARAGLGTGFTAFVNTDRGQRIILKSGLSPANMPPQPVNVYGSYQ